MHSKRKKRSRIRAAKVTAGHGHKKKNRGAGHRGGRGKAGSGKRGDFKIMKVTKGIKYLGKHGFKKNKQKIKTITLQTLQEKLPSLVKSGQINLVKDIYEIDLEKLGYDKLLSKGNIRVKLNITVSSASTNALNKIKNVGGKVKVNTLTKEIRQEVIEENNEENKNQS